MPLSPDCTHTHTHTYGNEGPHISGLLVCRPVVLNDVVARPNRRSVTRTDLYGVTTLSARQAETLAVGKQDSWCEDRDLGMWQALGIELCFFVPLTVPSSSSRQFFSVC
jgi:hypothetical protein